LISAENAKKLMALAIEEAQRSVNEDEGVHPLVGAIIASGDGEVLTTAHRGEDGTGRHAEFIALSKATEESIDLTNAELFVTLEPCTARGPGKTPCAQRIIESGIRRVHIGMLDPNPYILGHGDSALNWERIKVEHFPSELVHELRELNAEFIALHEKAHLPATSLYVSTQICDIVLQELQREGVGIHELPYEWDVSITDLIQFCRSYSSLKPAELTETLYMVRGRAYDKKYATYDYSNDARGCRPEWKDDFRSVLSRLELDDFDDRHIINVGIGNGLEGLGLFDKASDLTLIDIGRLSLDAAKKLLPNATAFTASAERLEPIHDSSQDVYVSLRTYQSSYLDVIASVREAHRVLRAGGLFVASVANAFVVEDGAIVSGLVIPHTTTVDRDRPFAVAEKIRRHLTIMKFADVGVFSGYTEIYVFGRRIV
jgi:pyrimidine deaminase RibD-like protein/SAM-dependent methyltransferase